MFYCLVFMCRCILFENYETKYLGKPNVTSWILVGFDGYIYSKVNDMRFNQCSFAYNHMHIVISSICSTVCTYAAMSHIQSLDFSCVLPYSINLGHLSGISSDPLSSRPRNMGTSVISSKSSRKSGHKEPRFGGLDSQRRGG